MKQSDQKAGSLFHDVTFRPEDFEVEDGGRCVRLRRGCGFTDRVGWPALPLDTRRLAIPYGATDVRVRVVSETWKAWKQLLQLAPAQEPRLAMNFERSAAFPAIAPPIPKDVHTARDGFPAPTRVELADEVYKTKEVAAPTAELRQVDHLAGNAIVGVQFAPLRWAPRTGRARYLAKVSIEVSWNEGAPRKPVTPRVALDEIRRLLPIVDNPLDVKRLIDVPRTFDDIPDICPEDPGLTRPRKSGPIEYPVWDNGRPYIPPSILFSHRTQDLPYLIITDNIRWNEDGTRGAATSDMVSAFSRLADWKSAKGTRARVVTVSDIMANRFGRHWTPGVTRDVQEAIRNFLQFAYSNWNTRWVLLGGDIDIVPIRHVLGDWGNRIEITAATPPNAGQANHAVGATTTHYHTPFVFAQSQRIFGRGNGTLGYRANATATSSGWFYATDNTFATQSTTPTEWVVIRAPAPVLDGELIAPQYGCLIPTDLYYAAVDGPLYRQRGKHDWDLDGNGIYGWNGDGNLDGIDFGCDLCVGRAPVDNAVDARVFVDKVLTYETFHDVRMGQLLDGEYPRRYLGVGDVWGSNWWDGTLDKASDSDMDGASMEKNRALDTLRSAGVAVDHNRRLLTDLFFDQRLASDLGPLTVNALRAAVAAGPHFVSVSGHGWWGGCCYLASSDPNCCDVRTLSNWPNNGIYFVDSCLTNELDVDKWRPAGQGAPDPNAVCLGKRIIRVADGGAVGYVGYSRVGAVGCTQEQEFWKALATPGKRHLGRMHDHAREIGSTRVFAWQIYVMNLNGDPEMRVWTQAPRRLTVSVTPEVYGKDRLTVSVFRAGEPVIDATVCVRQVGRSGTDTYFDVVEASAGHYTFDTSDAEDGELSVVVTGDNLIPHIASVRKVSLPESPMKRRTGAFVYDLAIKGGTNSAVIVARGDGRLECLDHTTLAPLWSTTLRTDGKPLVDLALSSDGSAAVVTRDAGGDNVHLVTATGSVQRAWSLGRQVMRVARSSDGNTLYAATIDTGLKALSRSNGAVLWSGLRHALHVATGPSNRVYASGDDVDGKAVVVCFNSDGTRRWTYVIGADWNFEPRAMAVHADGRCVVGTRSRELHAVSAAGVQLWKRSGLPASVVSLALTGTDVIAGRGDGVVERCALANGTSAWTIDIGERADVLCVNADRVYVGAWLGVFALNLANGNYAWGRATQGGVLSLAFRGTHLYAGSRDGWVYRIDEPRRIIGISPEHLEMLREGRVAVMPHEQWPGIRNPLVPPDPPGPDPEPRPR